MGQASICYVLSSMKPQNNPISSQSIRRLQAGELILREFNADEVVEITQTSMTSYYRWKKRLRENKNELSALSRKHSSGRPPKLSHEQLKQLRVILGESATAHGYKADRWTSAIVADLITKKFNVSLKPRAVRYILNKLGLSYQKPVVKDVRQQTAEIDTWIQRDWPSIKIIAKTGTSGCFSR